MTTNRLSGYTELPLSSGQVIPLKFCNGALHLFAEEMGIELLSDIDQALTCPLVEGKLRPDLAYLKALRLYVYAAAKYVCLVENRRVEFNPWQAAEWIEEVGTDYILQAIEATEKPDPDEGGTDSQDGKAEGPKTIQGFKFEAMARLNLLPDRYYDLTPAETAALLKGVNEREVFTLQNTRIVASLLRNAHFEKPVSAEKFMPLPGDEKYKKKDYGLPPDVFLQMLNSMFPHSTTLTRDGVPVNNN